LVTGLLVTDLRLPGIEGGDLAQLARVGSRA
jgi:FixJ family two-component response regulator